MKKLLVAVLFISACSHFQTKQECAESLVKKYLDSTLNDPHSYEKVSFDTLKPFIASYSLGDPIGKKMDTLAASYLDSSSKYSDHTGSLYYMNDKIKPNEKLEKLYKSKEDSVERIIKEKDKTYKGAILSYSIEHTYRAKNGFGALGLHTTRFQIDSTLMKITYAEELHNQ
ncbi:hypothetical protein [Mucilaginibacter sp. FT3.2]|uniref:hypothetical protein n=1 Tax=Mucilaginibacter sp. FT3.2 TaxID=2723090 RepID=UPI0016193587|nr:hypothetical protein [Mucilaginibacter sp. FT3.2]MBB6232985.1 hypothetical protein [Mucilaginibacter sp. FT3.2]